MPAQIRRIVVGVGLLGKRDPVLNIALGIAEELDAEVHAVHVYDPPDPLDVVYARYAQSEGADALERSRETQKRLEAHVRRIGGAKWPVTCHAVEGTPSERLLEIAEEVKANLLILGATRQDRMRRHFVGTTAQGVVSHAALPVLLLRQPIIRPLKRVLFTTNLSEPSTAVCRRGLESLRAIFPSDRPEMQCLLVLHPLERAAGSESVSEAARRELSQLLNRQLPEFAAVRARIREGDAAEWIVHETGSWTADLLILGNHGYPARQRGIGNVAGRVLREVACNVVVIPIAYATPLLQPLELEPELPSKPVALAPTPH